VKGRLNRVVLALLMEAGAAALLISTTGDGISLIPMSTNAVRPLHFSGYADAPPGRPLRLVFIHHSCGRQLLAAAGPGHDNSLVSGKPAREFNNSLSREDGWLKGSRLTDFVLFAAHLCL
jgi:hypothetical protein